ncbi:MAG: PKD domain-containing protein [Bacteroidota bacterium]|nr:PKD domain-containing protein [Bacteroidota bacterium]
MILLFAGCKEDIINEDKALADFSMKYLWSTDKVACFRFINKSTNIHSCNWSFGDGTGSSAINPVHHYYWSNNFRVRLKILNALWECDSIVKYINIQVQP